MTTVDQRQWLRAEPEVERIDLDPSSWVDVVRGLVPRADEVHDELVATVPWQPSRVFRYERWIDEPRLSCWQSGSGRHPALVETQAWISRRYRSLFDGVAITLYRDEHDGVGFHRDRELRWLEDTVIGVLTMGARRPWLMRPLTGHKADSDDLTGVIDLAPASGDLLVMGGRCQAAWLHAVPQTHGRVRSRVSAQWRWTSRRGRRDPNPSFYVRSPLQPVADGGRLTGATPPHAVTVATMRFSVWPSFQRSWREVLDLARHVESDGWHGLWFADHYMADTPDGSPSDDPALECWTALGALAAAVPRLQLGSLVSPSSVHHPALLAKQATTVDQVAGGRVVLGVGAGWQVNEHRAYGFELLPPKERVDRFAELIQVLRGLLHDQRTTFHGRWFTVEDAPCQPKGADGPIPIMVGTPSPRMLRLTARWADVWNGWGTPEAIRAKVSALDAACASEGRDPATVRRTAQGLFLLTDDPAVAEAVRQRAPADRLVAGPAAALVDQVGEYAAAGIDELIVPDFTLGRTTAERLESYDRFWTEVAAAHR